MRWAFRVRNWLPRWDWARKGCQFYVDHCEGSSDPNAATNGEDWVQRRFLPACDVAFDVGANAGDWTAQAVRIHPGLKVHAFEPSAPTFARLAARPFPPNVRLHPIGLGAREEEVPLFRSGAGSGQNSLYQRATEAAAPEQERIRIGTLDGVMAAEGLDRVDFVKIDVEGHELKVLEGAERALRDKRIRLIQFEYGGTYLDAGILLKDMFDLLQGHGYRVHKIFPAGLREIGTYAQRLENFKFQNFLAAHETL